MPSKKRERPPRRSTEFRFKAGSDGHLAGPMQLTSEETTLLNQFKTPEDFQDYIRSKKYNYQDVFQSFRQALRAKEINCFGGAMMGAAYIYFRQLGPPMVICMEAGHGDSDHNVAVYWKNGRVGSITASRSEALTGRPAIFRSYADLVMSYYPAYQGDGADSAGTNTLRGFCAPVDLRLFGERWLSADDSLVEIESYLYSIPYRKLFHNRPAIYADTIPAGGDFYYFPWVRRELAQDSNGRQWRGFGQLFAK
jgi:hypothetical protein